MQVVVQETIFAQAARAGGLRSQKTLTDNLVQKLLVESGCRMSQRRDDFLLIALASGQPMAAHLQLPRKKAPNPTDQHIGSRVRMRRKMLAMSQEQLAEALGITYQQVQKNEKGTNRIGASRLQQISHILQVPVTFFFEGAPNAAAPHDSSGSALSMAQIDDFVSDSNGLRLMRAFMRIDNAALRRRIVMLVQEIADDDDN
jgi:transcriptional regulator with XRE-family HTH domain